MFIPCCFDLLLGCFAVITRDFIVSRYIKKWQLRVNKRALFLEKFQESQIIVIKILESRFVFSREMYDVYLHAKMLKPSTSLISCMYSAPAHSSIATLVLEGELHFHTVGKRLPRLDMDVLLDNAGDPDFP